MLFAIRTGFALLACLLLGMACNRGDDRSEDSPALVPLDSGLYRADYQGHRGLLIFSAHPSLMSLAVDTSIAWVRLAWRGSVDLLGPRMEGVTYYTQEAPAVWSVARGGDTVVPAVRYRGREVFPGYLRLHFTLVLPDGDTLGMMQAWSHDNHYGSNGFQVEFDFAGLDTGMAAIAKVADGAEAGPWPFDWSLSVGRLEGMAGKEVYVQDQDGVGLIKCTFQGSEH